MNADLVLTNANVITMDAGQPRGGLVVISGDKIALVASGDAMASVAGAIAEFVGSELLAFSPEIIVENGGDIYLKSLRKRLIGIYAGESPLTGKIGLEINGKDTPLGICTSSGTVGHSLSYGKADAVIVLSPSAALADAVATAIGNRISQPSDIPSGIEFARGIDGLKGVIIIQDEKVGVWGEVKLCQMSIGG